MRVTEIVVAAVVALGLAAAVACGASDSETGEPTSARATGASPTLRATRTVAPVATAVATPQGAEEPAMAAATPGPRPEQSVDAPAAATGAQPPPAREPQPPAPSRTYTLQQGIAQVTAASITPPDLQGAWRIQTDVTHPGTQPDAVACGFLSGRTVANLAEDPVAAFLAGQTLASFSNVIAYSSAGGAVECAQRAAARLGTPGALAREFGDVFVDTDAVVLAPFDYPQVADGSIAFTLTGKTAPGGTTIDLTVLVIAFRKENVSVVLGSARSGSTPPASELTPLINLALSRLAAVQ